MLGSSQAATKRPWRLDPRRLSRTHSRDLLEIGRLAFSLLYVDARLHFLPRTANRAWLAHGRRYGPRSRLGPSTAAKVERILRLARSAGQLGLLGARRKNSCLCLALALRRRFAAMGLAARLVYGVRRECAAPGATAIAGHAWLELGGLALDPLGLEGSFSPLE
jgi:hypothetical protein